MRGSITAVTDSFLDGVLGGYGDDERTLARAHLTQLGAGDLVVMDRGYPSPAWQRNSPPAALPTGSSTGMKQKLGLSSCKNMFSK